MGPCESISGRCKKRIMRFEPRYGPQLGQCSTPSHTEDRTSDRTQGIRVGGSTSVTMIHEKFSRLDPGRCMRVERAYLPTSEVVDCLGFIPLGRNVVIVNSVFFLLVTLSIFFRPAHRRHPQLSPRGCARKPVIAMVDSVNPKNQLDMALITRPDAIRNGFRDQKRVCIEYSAFFFVAVDS